MLRRSEDGQEIGEKDEPKIDFAKMDGLVPGIVQDAKTGEMLMLGFLNKTSYAKTLETGFVTFWSRTRQKLWMKGETAETGCASSRLRPTATTTHCSSRSRLKATDWYATRVQ